MILTACAYPVAGVLFLCALSFTLAVADTKVSAAKETASTHGKTLHLRPVNGAHDVFTSSFLVRFRRSIDNDFAHKVADKYGFENLGAVSSTNNIFYMYLCLLAVIIILHSCVGNIYKA